MDNFSEATALSSTSRKFQSVWKTNITSICHKILIHKIPCYDQAFEYARAQPLDDVSSGQIEGMVSLAILVTKQFFANAHIACRALRFYEAQVTDLIRQCEDRDPDRLTEAQRKGFLRAWYRIHTLASLASDTLPNDILSSLDLLEFEQMMETFYWLMYWCPNEHRFELGITFQHRCLERQPWSLKVPKSPISAKHWDDVFTRLRSLSRDLHHSPLANPCSTCGKFNTIQDLYADIKKLGKGVRLADIVPLIRGGSDPEQEYRFSSRNRALNAERTCLS